MKAAARRTIIAMSCWGWLPPRAALWLLRIGRLSDA